jgi:hypothetical protein
VPAIPALPERGVATWFSTASDAELVYAGVSSAPQIVQGPWYQGRHALATCALFASFRDALIKSFLAPAPSRVGAFAAAE